MATQKKRMRSGFSCNFCKEKVQKIDFKDIETLKKYLTDYGRITSRFMNGNCAKCQRKVAKAIKFARYMALLPYAGTIHADE